MLGLFNNPDKNAGLRNEDVIYQPVDVSKLEQAAVARAFARLFSSDDGRVVLGYLQNVAFQRALSASASDEQLRYSEGQRGLVATILRLIDRGRQG